MKEMLTKNPFIQPSGLDALNAGFQELESRASRDSISFLQRSRTTPA